MKTMSHKEVQTILDNNKKRRAKKKVGEVLVVKEPHQCQGKDGGCVNSLICNLEDKCVWPKKDI